MWAPRQCLNSRTKASRVPSAFSSSACVVVLTPAGAMEFCSLPQAAELFSENAEGQDPVPACSSLCTPSEPWCRACCPPCPSATVGHGHVWGKPQQMTQEPFMAQGLGLCYRLLSVCLWPGQSQQQHPCCPLAPWASLHQPTGVVLGTRVEKVCLATALAPTGFLADSPHRCPASSRACPSPWSASPSTTR